METYVDGVIIISFVVIGAYVLNLFYDYLSTRTYDTLAKDIGLDEEE